MADGDGLLHLDPTPTTYRGTCDGSGAVALSFTQFADVNDEDQIVRIYERAKPALPVQTIDINAALGLDPSSEADLEELALIGSRLFVTTSHGRKSDGELDRARYRLAMFELAGSAPALTLQLQQVSSQVLDRMLVAANWDAPNAGVIAALTASSKLADDDEPALAPELAGTNIEALADDGTGKLLIGFRNPRPNNQAVVVSLVNPESVETARFGSASELDLGGLGIRAMAYSPMHQAVLIIAGSHAPGTTFKLYKWSAGAAPVFVTDITAPANAAPEAIVPYPGTKDVQILFDGGDVDACKDAPAANRVFTDAILRVD